MIALLPDLDSRFERLYGYLNDDVTRRRATVGLALELAGESAMSAARPGPAGAEPAAGRPGLVLVEDPDRPFLTRGLRVPDRVAAHLLGDDAPGRRPGRSARRGRAATERRSADQLGRALAAGRAPGPPARAGRRHRRGGRGRGAGGGRDAARWSSI